MANPTIQQLAADLAAGRTTSRKLTEEALERIEDTDGEGSRALCPGSISQLALVFRFVGSR